jgi:hypothetical protein
LFSSGRDAVQGCATGWPVAFFKFLKKAGKFKKKPANFLKKAGRPDFFKILPIVPTLTL